MPGSRLGPYEIQSALGAGGMGEVYRARDARLGRDVAIKILADDFVHDPERTAPFQRKAQVLAEYGDVGCCEWFWPRPSAAIFIG